MHHAYPLEDQEGFVGLRYWSPPDHLRYYFGSIYLFTANREGYSDLTRADMPQLRFMLAGEGFYTFHDGSSAETPQVCMLGPTMGATKFHLRTRASVLATSILPMGWMALGCDGADEWIDRLFDAETVLGKQYGAMLARLIAEPDPDLAAGALWQFLEAQLRPLPAGVQETVTAIDAWLSDDNSPKIETLVAETGLSARQVARYTNRLYGAPPKLLARKYRALRCASQIVLDKKNWVELCEEGTFYDQPHFIREIKQFIGLTPHQLMHDPTDVLRLTVQRRALTGVLEINRIS